MQNFRFKTMLANLESWLTEASGSGDDITAGLMIHSGASLKLSAAPLLCTSQFWN